MKRLLLNQIVGAVVLGMLCSVASVAARAEDRGTIAICPSDFDHGTKSGRTAAMRTMQNMLQHAGFTVILPADMDNPGHVPTDIRAYGQAHNAAYVLKSDIAFHSRSIWVDLGPRTNSTANVDVTIYDTADGHVVFTNKATARSDEKFDVVKAGADVVFTPLVTVVSGGPKAPHEQRAAQIAVYRALHNWTSMRK